MRRPALTQQELDCIAELTETGRFSAGQIAVKIGCSVGSVTWAQLRIGADPHPDKPLPAVPTEPVVAMRGGRPVRRFTQADDDLLLQLEAQGLSPSAIGRRLSPPRLPNSVRGRLMTLARRDARRERSEGDR